MKPSKKMQNILRIILCSTSICCITEQYAVSYYGPMTYKDAVCAYCHTLNYANNTTD